MAVFSCFPSGSPLLAKVSQMRGSRPYQQRLRQTEVFNSPRRWFRIRTTNSGGVMWNTDYLFADMAQNQGAGDAPILVKKNQKKPQAAKTESYAIAVRCSCSSVWCPKCFKKRFAPQEAARMGLMDWRRTRMVTLTLNPAGWVDGEDAYNWYKNTKPIGHFIENLGRAGIKVTDWTCNMEWHDNGFPHWHLLIEVDKPGKAGMIGQELLHKLWSHGDSSHRIHEYYFHSEERFKKFTGYFSKSGYLHKDKQHQITMPAWANGKEWAGVKINRFSSKRISTKGLPKPEEEKAEPAGEPERRPRRIMTYAAKHDRCGNQVDIWEVTATSYEGETFFEREYIGKFTVPYETVIGYLSGKFVEGYGYSFEGTTGFVCQVLKAWETAPPAPPERRKEFEPAIPQHMIDAWRWRHEIRANSPALMVV